MKLTIITINYNNCTGLQKTIDSVVSQEYQDFEWIIIDGGSTDGSRKLIEQYQERLAYWCSEPDSGIYNAMNKGIERAKGDYLLFLNSGDVFHDSDVLKKIINIIINEDVIYGDQIFIKNGNEKVFHYPDQLTIHYFLYRSLGHPSSFIKSSLFKNGGYREDLEIVSDWEKFIKWFLQGKSFKHVNVVIADFDATGISNSNIELLNQETNIVYDELFGNENRRWIEESVMMQQLYESCDNKVLKIALKLHNHGGVQAKLLYFLIITLNRIINLLV